MGRKKAKSQCFEKLEQINIYNLITWDIFTTKYLHTYVIADHTNGQLTNDKTVLP